MNKTRKRNNGQERKPTMLEIVFTVDKNYIQHLGVAVISLLENNKNLNLRLTIIHGGIDNVDQGKIKNIAARYNTEVKFIFVNDFLFEKFVINYHFTKANYYRLFIPELLDNDIDKVLYLDSDIVVNKKIDDLFKIDISGFYVAAVESPGFNRHKELKMSPQAKHFCSGVMLINLKKWREEEIHKKVIDFILKNPNSIEFADQCGLNAIINGQWLELNPKYDVQSSFFEISISELKKCFQQTDIEECLRDPVIIHYTGSSKPWHFMNKHPYKDVYWKYLKKTPWRDYRPYDLTVINIFKKHTPQTIKNFVKCIVKNKPKGDNDTNVK